MELAPSVAPAFTGQALPMLAATVTLLASPSAAMPSCMHSVPRCHQQVSYSVCVCAACLRRSSTWRSCSCLSRWACWEVERRWSKSIARRVGRAYAVPFPRGKHASHERLRFACPSLLVLQEKAKIRKEYERKEGQVEVKKKM